MSQGRAASRLQPLVTNHNAGFTTTSDGITASLAHHLCQHVWRLSAGAVNDEITEARREHRCS